MILPLRLNTLALIFASIALLQGTTAATVSRKSARGARERRQNLAQRSAGCGQVKTNPNIPSQFQGQCICFNPNDNVIFGQTPDVVTYANNNDYIYPQSTSNNGKQDCIFPGGGPITLNPYNGDCCGYTCTYGPCGEGASLVCLDQNQACKSGKPVASSMARRSLNGRECPEGRTSCAVEFSAKQQFYECLDTQSDLESCGGCMYPDVRFGGSTASGLFGQDCSAIPDVSEVACVKGQCVVSACDSGSKLVDGACVQDSKAGISAQQLLRAATGFA